jgi:hypothetical protein
VRFEIEARATGEHVTIDYLDWLHLLNLAIRYGWEDMADLEHYLHDAPGMPAGEAAELADALARAEHDLQTRPTDENAPVELGPPKGAYEAAHDYFAGERRWLVSKLGAMGRSGELGISRAYP